MACWNRCRHENERAMTDKNFMMSELHIEIHNLITHFIVCLDGGLYIVLSAVPRSLSSGRLYTTFEEFEC